MWPKFYRDYPPNSPLRKQRVEPMQGIIGCEMHEQNGWGDDHLPPVSTRDDHLPPSAREEPKKEK